jgi:hypothetical protein
VASSPHDFKLLMQADGRKGTTMDDVAVAESRRDAGKHSPQPAAGSGATLTVA